MRRGRAVILGFPLAVVRAERDQPDGFGPDVQVVFDEPLVVVEDFHGGRPFSGSVHDLDPVMFDQTFGKAETRVVVGLREEERRRGMERVGIAVGIFAVEIAVKDQPDTVHMCFGVEGVGDGLVRLSVVAVIFAPDPPVHAVQQRGRIAVIGGQRCPFREFGGLASEAGQEAVVVHQDPLDLADLLFGSLTRRESVFHGDRSGSSRRLPDHTDRPHHAGGTERNVRCADVSAREHQVLNVF